MSKYTITHNYGMCPNQIHGFTDDGQQFYFRGRGGKWTLHFGATEEEVTFGPGFEGLDANAGWYELDEWEAFFWQTISEVEAGTAQALDVEAHEDSIRGLLVRLTTPATQEQINEALELVKEEQK
jgi:hypothetical protein